MILNIYIVIISYFILGGIAFYFIGRKKDKQTARKIRTKYITYFLIIHVLFFSIITKPSFFQYISLLIVFTGIGELIFLFKKQDYGQVGLFLFSLIILLIFSTGFIWFSQLNMEIVLFTFLVVSIFDAFSQITGQLMGKRKIFPKLSPEKTVEGLIGGILVATASSLLLSELAGFQSSGALILSIGIIVFAFLGDMAASFYKRRFKVKDFSRLLPGQGGFLDRFDSLIAGGALIGCLELLGILKQI